MPAQKLEPVAVNYRPSGDANIRCGACANYDGMGTCKLVAGVIRPDAVCDLFSPSSEGMSDVARDKLEREIFTNG